tara:strand:+ start:127 stop:369 length:243 start_codon:yes stop_codon:yes gene_type:complete
MKFVEILEGAKVFPGEYILHVPTNQVVLCGAFSPDSGDIRAMARGKMFSDKIVNFKKISMSKEERTKSRKSQRCGSCKKK